MPSCCQAGPGPGNLAHPANSESFFPYLCSPFVHFLYEDLPWTFGRSSFGITTHFLVVMARRKTKKQAAFKRFSNCFERKDQEQLRGNWREVFGNDHPLTLELGCGKAEFLLQMARKYPQRNFVGVDLKADRLWRPALTAQEQGLANAAFLQANLLQLSQFFAPREAAEIWITFPDPFPKNRQAKHRMINPPFLRQYEQIMHPHGYFYLKTDNRPLFHYALEVLVDQPHLRLCQLSFNLHEDERIFEDARFKTTYERKFLDMGEVIHFVKWQAQPALDAPQTS